MLDPRHPQTCEMIFQILPFSIRVSHNVSSSRSSFDAPSTCYFIIFRDKIKSLCIIFNAILRLSLKDLYRWDFHHYLTLLISQENKLALRPIWSTNTRLTENMFYGINTEETDSMTAPWRRKIYFGFYTKHIVNTANLFLATKRILSRGNDSAWAAGESWNDLGINICCHCLANINATPKSISFNQSETCHILTFLIALTIKLILPIDP